MAVEDVVETVAVEAMDFVVVVAVEEKGETVTAVVEAMVFVVVVVVEEKGETVSAVEVAMDFVVVEVMDFVVVEARGSVVEEVVAVLLLPIVERSPMPLKCTQIFQVRCPLCFLAWSFNKRQRKSSCIEL